MFAGKSAASTRIMDQCRRMKAFSAARVAVCDEFYLMITASTRRLLNANVSLATVGRHSVSRPV